MGSPHRRAGPDDTIVGQSPSGSLFSDELETWLRATGPKTLGELRTLFAERSFAVAAMLLMFLPALPLPTGGVSHAFEIVTILIAAQMVNGRHTLWLPRSWQRRELGRLATEKAIPPITRWIRRFERHAQRRGASVLEGKAAQRVVGLVLIAAAVTALAAPPFSGLDTFPAMGAVIICLGFILRDLVILASGIALTAVGAALIATLGMALARSVSHLF